MAYGAGFYTEYKFTQAALEKQTVARLNAVNKGVTKLVKFNGNYDNATKGDDCAGRDMPVRLRKLLR